MLTSVAVDGERYRVDTAVTRSEVEAFKAQAGAVQLTDDPAQNVRAIQPLMRLLIHPVDWRRYWATSCARRRSYQQHRLVAQQIVDGRGFSDLLDEAGLA